MRQTRPRAPSEVGERRAGTEDAAIRSQGTFSATMASALWGKFGAVAQLVAHLHGMQGVRGSSPLSSTLVETEREGPSVMGGPFSLR